MPLDDTPSPRTGSPGDNPSTGVSGTDRRTRSVFALVVPHGLECKQVLDDHLRLDVAGIGVVGESVRGHVGDVDGVARTRRRDEVARSSVELRPCGPS